MEANYIEVHPRFSKGSFDIAVIQIKGAVQFNSFLYPICLPDWPNRNYEDLDPGVPEGQLKTQKNKFERLYYDSRFIEYQPLFSIKALVKGDKHTFPKIYTDANGPQVYRECDPRPEGEDVCIRDRPPPINLTRSLDEQILCERFYKIVEAEENDFHKSKRRKQIYGLNRNYLECFSIVKIYKDIIDQANQGMRTQGSSSYTCYERRMSCIRKHGWCYKKDIYNRTSYGFCHSLNDLPMDEKNGSHWLFEVPTYVFPQHRCADGAISTDSSQVCTGHVSKLPSQYTFEVETTINSQTGAEINEVPACGDGHPYAIRYGDTCCNYVSYGRRQNCNKIPMFNDTDCCSGLKMRCPHKRECINAKYKHCPEDHPKAVAFGLKCCKGERELVNQNCWADKELDLRTKPECCADPIDFECSEEQMCVDHNLGGNDVFVLQKYRGETRRENVVTFTNTGRMINVFSSLYGVHHGEDEFSNYDEGAPTYIRYPVDMQGSRQEREPGNKVAVLYSLQKGMGKERKPDGEGYMDSEALVAHHDVVDWLQNIIMEDHGYRKHYGDPFVTVHVDQWDDEVTTSITTSFPTTTLVPQYYEKKFWEDTIFKGAGMPFGWFKRVIAYPGRDKPEIMEEPETQPPLIFFEGYYDLVKEEEQLNGAAHRSCAVTMLIAGSSLLKSLV